MSNYPHILIRFLLTAGLSLFCMDLHAPVKAQTFETWERDIDIVIPIAGSPSASIDWQERDSIVDDLWQKGIIAQNTGNYREAESIWRQALQATSNEAIGKYDKAGAHHNLGNALAAQGKYDEAEKAYREAIRIEPTQSLGHESLGNFLRQQKRYGEAEAAFRQIIALNPSWAEPYDRLGDVLRLQERYSEAEAAFRKAIALAPSWAFPYGGLGEALEEQERYSEAEAAFRQAIALDPSWAWAHNNLGDVLRLQERYNEAENAFRQAITLSPSWAQYHDNLGEVLRLQERYNEAENAFRQAIAFDPSWAWHHNSLGKVLEEQERYSEAEAAFRRAIALDPSFSSFHNDLGRMLSNQKRYSEAETAFRQAIALDPSSYVDYFNLGLSLEDQEQYSEAEKAFRESLRLYPDYRRAYYRLGGVLGKQEKYREAEKAFQQAIQLELTDAWGYNDLGTVLLEQEKYKEAEKAFQQAIQLEPTNADFANNIGLLFKEQERFDEAEDAYKKAITLSSDYYPAANLNLGMLLAEQEQYVEAETILSEFVRFEPESLYGRLYLGAVIDGLGRSTEAENLYKEMISSPIPHSALFGYLGLGALYKDQNRLEESIQAFNKILSMYPEATFFEDQITEVERELSLQNNPSTSSQRENLPRDEPNLRLLRSVVRVVTGSNSNFGGPQYGTGWVVKREGDRIWILTNRHVVSEQFLDFVEIEGKQKLGSLSGDVQVDFYSEPPENGTFLRLPAEVIEATDVIASEGYLDLAILVVDNAPKDIRPLEMASEAVGLNVSIQIYGHHNQPWAIARGYVSVRPQDSEIQIAGATIGRRSSGSPILNDENQVVGIITSIEPPNFGGGDEFLGGFSYGHPSPALIDVLTRWGVL